MGKTPDNLFNRKLPAIGNIELAGYPGHIAQIVPGKPGLQDIISSPQLLIQKRLLRLQRGAKALDPLAFLRDGLLGVTLMLSGVVELILDRRNALSRFLAFQLQCLLLFQQLLKFRSIHLAFKQFLLILQFALASEQLLNGVFERANPGLRQLGLAPGIRRAGAEIFPLVLPVAHGVFGLLQFLARLFRAYRQRFLFWLHHVQLFLDTRQLVLVLLQFPGQLALVGHGLVQFRGHLPATLALVLKALFDTGDIGAGLVVACLGPIEMFGPFLVIVPEGFE